MITSNSRFYHQFFIGCEQSDCKHKLCKSAISKGGTKLSSDACVVISFQLASKPGNFQFCERIPVEPSLPPQSTTPVLNRSIPSSPLMSLQNSKSNLSQSPQTAFSSLLLTALSKEKNTVDHSERTSSVAPTNTLGETFTDLMKSLSFSNLFATMSNNYYY